MAKRGTRPEEIYKTSLVTVWPEDALPLRERTERRFEDGAFMGIEVELPNFFVVEMRRLGTGKFRTRMMQAGKELDVDIPEEVLERMIQLRDRIISEQKSARSSEQAVKRMTDGALPFEQVAS